MNVRRRIVQALPSWSPSKPSIDVVYEDDPLIGVYHVVVRDVDEPDLGYTQESVAPDTSELTAWGFGELKGAAFDEIEDAIDLEEHVGEEVATIVIDCDSWEYEIDWRIDP
jgi:hypothetical protein